ncbi:MAG: polyprenol monophosphomannose synthase [Anaerolineales bacterium]|nr:polyprenol monophosphomannose synthase [Anaerolineales bacterium]
MKTQIILPTYNEVENLEPMIDQLLALPLPDLHVLIIDDNSQDGTGQIADVLCARYPEWIAVLHRPGKLGLGTAYITGFRWAIEQGADNIVQMDCDFSHSPGYLPDFVSKLDEYDVVVGSRYVPGGKLDPRWSGWRYFLSKWANSVWVHFILGNQTQDATAGFKCWSRRALEQIPLDKVRSNGYVFQVEMAYLCEKLGMRILEWPIYFEDRRIGKSKMTVPVKLEAAWRVLQIRLHYGALNRSACVEFQRV